MQAINRQLQQYGIDPETVPVIDGKPWLTSEQLSVIARQRGAFSLIEVSFVEFVQSLNQAVWRALVTDADGRSYSRSGVATVGEKLPTGEVADVDELAASRALRSTLAMAGFDLFKPGAVLVGISEEAARKFERYKPRPSEIRPHIEFEVERADADEVATRNSSIRQLHAIAEEAGLIVRRPGQSPDYSAYRTMLEESFDVTTCVNFTEQQFAQAIGMIRCMMTGNSVVHAETK